jgi:uncharacterized repeat protein (TIGR01451 family)
MKRFSLFSGFRNAFITAMLAVGILAPIGNADAVYINRFSTIANGAVTFTGNTLGLDKGNGNAPGVNGAIGTFITTNLSSVDGTYPPGTTSDWRKNSSSAQLVIPAGSTILYAELIWSGSYSYGNENVIASLNNAVTLQTPSGLVSVTPSGTTAQTLGTPSGTGLCPTTTPAVPCYYVRSADVTSLVTAGGAGTYTIGGVPATQGDIENNANTAGWTLAVVYQNGSMPSRNLSLFVGAEKAGDAAATVSGFCTPPTGPRSGRLLVSAIEGDRGITGDQMQFGPTAATLTALSGSNNNVSNFFASQINNDSGLLDTSGTFGTSNHSLAAAVNGARQGYDITNVDVSAQLANNQTSAVARGTSTGDQYVINALALQINVGAPIFPVSTKTANIAVAKVGDVITYTVGLDNRTGTADATNTLFKDALPAGLSYVAGSFTLDGVSNPGNPTTGVNIGTVAAGAIRTVTFQARVDSIPAAPAAAQYDNAASWSYEFIPCAGQPISKGTLTTNPASTKIARLLPSKTAFPSGNVNPNDIITYTVNLTNNGTASSSGTTLQDPIPANTSYILGSTKLNGITVADIAGSMPFINPNLVNSSGNSAGVINVGQSAIVSFQVKVNAAANGAITNTAIGDIDGAGGAPNSPAFVSNSITSVADLSILKTGPATFTPTGNAVYTVVIKNAGPSAANSATFSDTLPATLTNPTASCSNASDGAVCPSTILVNGNAVSGTIATLPAGGSITLQIGATVAASANGNISNTAIVTPPTGTVDPSVGNNSSTTAGIVNPNADLVVTKTGPTTSSAGSAISYQIVVRNDGPSAANGATFNDVVPANISGVSATCTIRSGAAACPTTVGISGNTVSGAIPSLPAGASVAITVTGIISTSATGSLANTVTVSPPGGTTDSNSANNSATATTVLGALADISIVKTGPSALVNGAPVTYTITISNAGPSDANGTSFSDIVPSTITSVTASCANASGGAVCPSAVSLASNNVSGLAPTLPAGSSISIIVSGVVTSGASGVIVNTASASAPAGVSDPNLANNTSNTAATVNPKADLSITKTGPPTVNAGGTMTYNVVIRNNGPADVVNASFSDNSPADLNNIVASCVSASGGALCPANFSISGSSVAATLAQLPVGSSVVLAITGTVNPSAAGSITNAASVSTPSGTPDTDPSNNTSAVTTTISPIAKLSIVKTGPAAVNAGSGITYSLVISNAGPSAANGASFSDTVPSDISGVTASCANSQNGATCPASVSVVGNSVSGLIPNLPAGGSVTITIAGNVNGTATTAITNTARITPPTGVTDPDLSDNTSTTSTPVAAVADIRIVKYGPATVNAGGVISYTLLISNTGPSAANSTSFNDILDVNLTPNSATCGSAAGGAVCPGVISVSGNTVSGNIPTLPSGGSVVITIQAQVAGSAAGTINNTASVNPAAGVNDPDPANNQSSVATSIKPIANLSVSKVGPSTVNAGGAVSYDVTLTNAGPSAADGATFNDAVPVQITGTTASCSAATNGAVCPATLSLSGNNISAIIATLPSGSSVTIKITGTISSNATGSISNSASITPPPGVADPDITNNTSTTNAAVNLIANVAVQKMGPSSFSAGGAISYTIRISNAGPSAANGTTFNDLVPTTITGITASCGSATNGAVCPSSVNVSGNTVNGAIPTLPSGASVVITINGVVSPGATGTISNTATIALPPGVSDPDQGNNTSTVSTPVTPTADVSIIKTAPSNATPGSSISYTLVINNAGPSAANGTGFSDTVNTAIGNLNASCANALNGAVCPSTISISAGGVVSAIIPNLPSNSSITITINGTVSGSASGAISNTATLSLPSGTVDPNLSNNTSTISTTLSPTADLQVTKVKLLPLANLIPGQPVRYQIELLNNGPSNAIGVALTDALPAGLASMSWTCTVSGNADCDTNTLGTNASGVGAIAMTAISLNAGAANKITIIVDGIVANNATNSVSNTVTVAPPSGTIDPNLANNTATVTSPVTLTADVTVLKTGPATINAGQVITYLVKMTNAGPSAADGTSFIDNVPAGITNVQAICDQVLATNGAVCPSAIAVSANNVNASVPTLPAFSSVTFTITGTVSGTAPNTLLNTATVNLPSNIVDPTPANNSSASTTVVPVADLGITKVGPSAINGGGSISYSLRVSNTGPSPVSNALLTDNIPASINSLVITCAGETGGAVCPSAISQARNISVAIPSLPSGSGLTFTVAGVVDLTTTGTIINQATIAPPVGTIDPNSANDSSTERTAISPNVNLAIIKGGSTTALAGGPITYTLTISNAIGFAAADDATFLDVVPANVSVISASCGSALAGAICPSSVNLAGNTVSGSVPTLPAGGSVVITILGTVRGSATGVIANTATVSPAAGMVDLLTGNNSDTLNTSIGLSADIRVKKTGPTSIQPSQPISYTIVVNNDGPSASTGTTLSDIVSNKITNVSVTCGQATGGAICPSGSMNTNNVVNTLINTLPANSSLSFVVTGIVANTASGDITNIATVSTPGITDPNLGNETSTVVTSINATADLSIAKIGPSSAQAGGPISYTVTLTNAGPSAANGTVFSDAVPASINGISAICSATTGQATCPGSISIAGNNVNATLDNFPGSPSGSSITFIVSGTVSGSATGSFTNTATLTPPAGFNDTTPINTSSVTTSVQPVANLIIEKTGPSGVNAGAGIAYQLKIRNTGPSAANGATFSDVLPASIGSISASCAAATNGAACPAPITIASNTVSAILATLPNGGEIIININGTVQGSATGIINNTATVSPPPGTIDPNPSDSTSTVLTPISPVADIQIIKTGTATANAAGQIAYNIRIVNNGPSAANNTSFSDLLPNTLVAGASSCANTGGGAVCPANVSIAGNQVSATIPTLPAGGVVNFTVNATVVGSASGIITNTAIVEPPLGVLDPDISNNLSTTGTTVQLVADVRVLKTGPVSANAGATVNYVVTVINQGPSAANGTTMADNVPPSLDSVIATCQSSTGGASCPAPTVVGNNVQATIASMPLGSTVTFNVQGRVVGGAVGSITNSVTVSPPSNVVDPDPTNNTALSSSPVQPVADVRIEKTGPASVNAGAPISYTLLITNGGPSSANNTSFVDSVPNDITSITASCGSAANGAVCPSTINIGTNNIVSGAIPTLPVGGSLIITINGIVKGTAIGPLSNTATVTLDPSVQETNLSNNSSTVTTTITPVANLSITKVGSNAANVGGPISYAITVSNAGPSAASNTVIVDDVPTTINTITATCTQALNAAICPATVGVATNLVTATIPTLPAGSSVQIIVNGTVSNSATDTITNTARVTPPAGTVDPDVTNNSAVASVPLTPTSDLKIEKFVKGTHNAGDPITYTVKVTNLGPSRALGSVMTDTIPADISGISVTCSEEVLGATCPLANSLNNQSGNTISATIASMPAGSSVVFSIKGNLSTTASGIVSNTARIAPATGVADLVLANNSAQADTNVTPLADLSVTKVRTSSGAALLPGAPVTYQIIVRNAGPAPASGIQVTDNLPTALTNATWQCVASGTADCDTTSPGTGATGTGNINLANVLVAGNAASFVTINVSATLSNTAEGTVVNNAQLTPPSTVIDPVTTNNLATDTSAVATTIRGHAFSDSTPDGSQGNGEINLSGLTVTITPVTGGTPIIVTTDSNGDYIAPVTPNTNYSVVITPPPGQAATTRNNPQVVRSGNINTLVTAPPVGFAVTASISGSVWRDLNHDRQRNISEPAVPLFKVEVLDASGQIVASAITDANGNYAIAALVPSIVGNPATHYTVRFRDTANNVLYGRPVSQDANNPNGKITNGIIEGLVLVPGVNTNNQSLPLDPSGVVYDSSNRQPIAGAVVQLIAPPGFNPAIHLLGGVTAVNQTTGGNGFYQYLLLPGAPSGNYSLSVTPPSNFLSPSIQIPPQPGVFSPPSGPGVFAVQAQEKAPAIGQVTTYFLAFNLQPNSADIVNNHIPLDPMQASSLFVTKSVDKAEAELGDSVLYTVSIRNTSGPSLSNVTLADRLPAGFRFIPGTAIVIKAGTNKPLSDPLGGVGPNLSFAVGSLAASDAIQVTYRVRLGVGSQQGDGINRAQAISGNSQSNVAQARVKVAGGVFTEDACLVGKIFVDCNGNHLQDPEELGIPGVRMYLEDGTWLVSDTEGKYSFCGLKPITHVIKVDKRTLPVGSALTSSSNRNALDPNSLFIDTKMGELNRADFIEGTCKPEVVNQVKARRAQGRVVAPETERNKTNPGLTIRSRPVMTTPSPRVNPSQGGAN